MSDKSIMRKEAKAIEEVNKLLQADKAQNSPHLPKKLLAKGRLPKP